MELPRRKHAEHENHERWLVSYADFITLLFAFFVVMYASSTNNPTKVQQFEDAIRNQMNLDSSGGAPAYQSNGPISKSLIKNPAKPTNKNAIDDMAGNVGDPELETIKQEMQRNKVLQAQAEEDRFQKNLSMINEALKEEIETRKVVVATHEQEIVLFIDTRIGFEPGLAQVKSDFDIVLQKMATVLDDVKGKIKVSGHSDTERLPASSTYQNHLELSSARATQFGSSLIQRSKTLEDRLGIESFGSSKPVNKTGSIYQNITNGRIEVTIYQK